MKIHSDHYSDQKRCGHLWPTYVIVHLLETHGSRNPERNWHHHKAVVSPPRPSQQWECFLAWVCIIFQTNYFLFLQTASSFYKPASLSPKSRPWILGSGMNLISMFARWTVLMKCMSKIQAFLFWMKSEKVLNGWKFTGWHN